MIRRDDGRDWLLIPQIEHAHVAGDIAAAWGNEDVPPFPGSDELLAAVRHHDDGWREWDTAPRLDLETGVPRSFLEMPMPVATEIWSRSIDICSRSTSSWLNAVRAAEVLKPSATSPAQMQNSIVAAISELNRAFVAEDVIDQLHSPDNSQTDVRALIYRTLHLLELGGWLRKINDGDAEQRYQTAWPFDPPSPLGGIAVSKHFYWLAEQARESRSENSGELQAVECFLESQRHQQRVWNGIARQSQNCTQAELNETKDHGFHAVQFFDRLSLWLCCAPRTDAVELDCPGQGKFTLLPIAPFRVAIDPFPLSPAGRDSLELSVSAKRIAARRYADNDDLLNALHDSTAERLTWTLTATP